MTEPTLREYIETVIKFLKEYIETVINLKHELLDNKIKSAQTALELQADKYEQRLLTLNHEAEQLKEMRATSISKEFYEVKQEELIRRITSLELSQSNNEGKASQKSVMITWLIAGIGLLIAMVNFIRG